MNKEVSTSRVAKCDTSGLKVFEPDFEGLKKVQAVHVETLSGILSDIEIEQLCTLPDKYTDLAAVQRDMDNFSRMSGGLYTMPMLQDNLDKINVEHARLTELYTHKVTPEIREAFKPMIENFVGQQVKLEGEAKKISYGLSSFGYDVRLSMKMVEDRAPFVIFSNHNTTIVDPKRPDPCRTTLPLEVLEDPDGSKYVIMPAHSYGMGFTEEIFNIPPDVNVICVGKSTYARASVFVNVTPIEAGFSGTVVIELGNPSGLPVKIYLNEGIAQFVFQRGNRRCRTSYGDRDGKYQGQRGIVHAKV